MIKCGEVEAKFEYGCQRRNHNQTGRKRNLVALDYQRARRSGLVHRLGRFKLHIAVFVRNGARAAGSDGRALGHLDRRATRSEERRVGKECRSRWSAYYLKKNIRELMEDG